MESGDCQSCSPSCFTCENNNSNCTSCKDGKYLEGGICKKCDNTKCATCSDKETCLKKCNKDCKECDTTG